MENRIGKVEQSGRQGDCDLRIVIFSFPFLSFPLLNPKSWSGYCAHTLVLLRPCFFLFFLLFLILLFVIHDGRICNQEPLRDPVDEIHTNL